MAHWPMQLARHQLAELWSSCAHTHLVSDVSRNPRNTVSSRTGARNPAGTWRPWPGCEAGGLPDELLAAVVKPGRGRPVARIQGARTRDGQQAQVRGQVRPNHGGHAVHGAAAFAGGRLVAAERQGHCCGAHLHTRRSDTVRRRQPRHWLHSAAVQEHVQLDGDHGAPRGTHHEGRQRDACQSPRGPAVGWGERLLKGEPASARGEGRPQSALAPQKGNKDIVLQGSPHEQLCLGHVWHAHVCLPAWGVGGWGAQRE